MRGNICLSASRLHRPSNHCGLEGCCERCCPHASFTVFIWEPDCRGMEERHGLYGEPTCYTLPLKAERCCESCVRAVSFTGTFRKSMAWRVVKAWRMLRAVSLVTDCWWYWTQRHGATELFFLLVSGEAANSVPSPVIFPTSSYETLCSFKLHQSQSCVAKVPLYAAQIQGYVAQMQGYTAVFSSSFSTMICSMFLSYAMDLPLII